MMAEAEAAILLPLGWKSCPKGGGREDKAGRGIDDIVEPLHSSWTACL